MPPCSAGRNRGCLRHIVHYFTHAPNQQRQGHAVPPFAQLCRARPLTGGAAVNLPVPARLECCRRKMGSKADAARPWAGHAASSRCAKDRKSSGPVWRATSCAVVAQQHGLISVKAPTCASMCVFAGKRAAASGAPMPKQKVAPITLAPPACFALRDIGHCRC